MEWCQDAIISFDRTPDDTKQVYTLSNEHSRLLRGGSFVNRVRVLRSAYRDRLRPDYWGYTVGFRPARTYH